MLAVLRVEGARWIDDELLFFFQLSKLLLSKARNSFRTFIGIHILCVYILRWTPIIVGIVGPLVERTVVSCMSF